MHYQIFIPNKTGCDPKHLREVGLEQLLREGDRGPNATDLCGNGPGGLLGVVLWWEPNARPGYRPEFQRWTPAKPDLNRGLAAARFWIGLDNDSPPTPADLVRGSKALLDGMETLLGDGHEWVAPNVMRLPIRFSQNDAGELVTLPKRHVETIHEKCLWAFGKLAAMLRGEADIPHVEVVQYCADMLAINYRVTAEICHLLELFDAKNVEVLMARTTDLEKLLDIRDEVKKKAAAPQEAASAPHGSAT